jgi:predicted AlkP superfamily phosphohydrolase/phosphomutase
MSIKRVIVIGLDGLEPKIVDKLLAQDELPNLKRLQDLGGYSRVKTTFPAQTPVAWSTFSTGTNPGGHGIFDFLSRDPNTYLPILGLTKYEQKNAFVPPQVVNMRRGKAFWELLSDAGIASTVLRCPCTYPPDAIRGKMLSGVGVPDLRGGLGTSTYYTSASGVPAEASEKVVQVQVNADRTIKTYLIGPRHPRSRTDIPFDITLELDNANRIVKLKSNGDPEVLTIREGEWSDFLKVRFKVGMLQSVRGIVRLYLRQMEPVFELYASPVNFDPEAPLFPISFPAEYASEISNRMGSFYTTGMPEDHDGLNNERFDEAAYLAQCELVMQERRAMMRAELARFKQGFFFCLFDTPDRLQHMFWRYYEKDHPANKDRAFNGFVGVIEDHYRSLDKIVGEALAYSDDKTLFIVLSDHGMNSFQRGLNVNTWLYENQLLVLKNGETPGEGQDDFFRNVDWDQTKAYSLGLGGIFLNLKGREANGIVKPDEVKLINAQIISGLVDLCDTERGQKAIRSVLTREQIYSGPYAQESPDLLINFATGYRVSWGTPLGGVPAGMFEDNTKRWAGDHVIDPAFVPGVLFMNRKYNPENSSLTDLAPTILSALGVTKIPEMEGSNLLI